MSGVLVGGVDLAAAVTVGLFCLYGVIRGLTIQLVGLLVLLAALVAGDAACATIGAWIRSRIWEQMSPVASRGVGFVLVVLGVLTVVSLVLHLCFGGFPSRPRVPFDRVLGGLLGAGKGALVVMAVLLLVVNVLWNEEEDEDDDEPPPAFLRAFLTSRSACATRWFVRRAAGLLPEGASRRVGEYLGPLEAGPESGN